MTQNILEHWNRKRGERRGQTDKTPIISIASLRAALARLSGQFPPGFTACLDPSLRLLAAHSDQIQVPRPLPQSSDRQHCVFFLRDLLLLLHGLHCSWVGLSFLFIVSVVSWQDIVSFRTFFLLATHASIFSLKAPTMDPFPLFQI
jgi:hypothetical protein